MSGAQTKPLPGPALTTSAGPGSKEACIVTHFVRLFQCGLDYAPIVKVRAKGVGRS
jgi:hypothetical protein